MKKTMRKRGRRKDNLDDESTVVVLQRAKAQLHWDFGGRDPIVRIRERARELGVDMGPKSAALVLEMLEEQMEEIRGQVHPLIDQVIEAERRREPEETCP